MREVGRSVTHRAAGIADILVLTSDKTRLRQYGSVISTIDHLIGE